MPISVATSAIATKASEPARTGLHHPAYCPPLTAGLMCKDFGDSSESEEITHNVKMDRMERWKMSLQVLNTRVFWDALTVEQSRLEVRTVRCHRNYQVISP